MDLLRVPAYAVPLVVNLTGSVWFFLLIGKAGGWFSFLSFFLFFLGLSVCLFGWLVFGVGLGFCFFGGAVGNMGWEKRSC